MDLNCAASQQAQLHWNQGLLQHAVHLERQQQMEGVSSKQLLMTKKTTLVGYEEMRPLHLLRLQAMHEAMAVRLSRQRNYQRYCRLFNAFFPTATLLTPCVQCCTSATYLW
jgi:hypothetical protein